MGPWFEFEVLKAIDGPLYEQKRRDWLGAFASQKDRLTAEEASPDWKTATTARVLLGWLDHGPRYDALLQGLDKEDPAAAQRTIKGLNLIWDKYAAQAEHDLGPEVLPLCWEVILKHADDWPEWKVVTFFRMLGAKPDARSVGPLLACLQAPRVYRMRHEAIRALARVPRLAWEEQVEKVRADHAEALGLLDDLEDEAAPD